MICNLYLPTIIKYRIFQQMNCIRLANVMNNIVMTNIFNSGNNNIAEIKTTSSNHDNHYKQNFKMWTPDDRSTSSGRQCIIYCYYFDQDQFLCLNQFYHNAPFKRPIHQIQKTYQTQKDYDQDNLSFACLRFYKQNSKCTSKQYLFSWTGKESI